MGNLLNGKLKLEAPTKKEFIKSIKTFESSFKWKFCIAVIE